MRLPTARAIVYQGFPSRALLSTIPLGGNADIISPPPPKVYDPSGQLDDDKVTTKHQLPPPKYYVPKEERRDGKRSVYEIAHVVGETRLARNSRTCPTRELYFLHPQWNKHKSPYRRLRHMTNLFSSAPFQRLLFPELFCVGTVAGALTYFNEVTGSAMMVMPSSAFAGATTAIGLLAGFRLNASYGRYTEGRKLWSEVNSSTRNLARQAQMFLMGNEKTRLVRLCQAYPVALLFHLNDKGCYHNMKRKSRPGEAPFEDRVQAEFEAEMKDVYLYGDQNMDGVLKKDYERFCRIKSNGGNVPLLILTCMSETISKALKNDPSVDTILARELDEQVQIMTQALGGCERMVKTPLPTGFTRHFSRLLFIWSNCLPFALYPLVGPLGTLPSSLLTAFAVLGIEDISIQLEEPMDILPLRQFSDSMHDGIRAIEDNYLPEDDEQAED